jgi:hypothetical protein
MASKSKPVTPEELASLLKVANRSAILEPPAINPSEHRARLIGLGYMANISGRLRMTTTGRRQTSANQAAEDRSKLEVNIVSRAARREEAALLQRSSRMTPMEV